MLAFTPTIGTSTTLALDGSSGLAGEKGLLVELWCRCYYPNVREHLLAKGLLPLTKLQAFMQMHRAGVMGAQGSGAPPGDKTIQSFSIPLLYTSESFKHVPTFTSISLTLQYSTSQVQVLCFLSNRLCKPCYR